MKTMYKLFGIIALAALVGFSMTACTDPTGPTVPSGNSAQEKADAFKTAHAAILAKTTGTVTITDETAVNTALAAYNALSDDVKALLTAEKTLLDQLNQKIGELKTTFEGQAEAFKTAHAAILAKELGSLVLSDSAAVHTALTAYDELPDNVKALLATEKALLDQQLAKITELEQSATPAELAESFRTGYAAILGLTAGTVTLAHKAGVEAALEAYDRYNSEVQALLSTEKTKLDVLIAQIDLLVKAAEFKEDHAAILGKTVSTVAITDEEGVDAALDAFEDLDSEVQALLGAEKTLLDGLKAHIGVLKTQAAAQTFRTAYAAILAKTVATVAIADEEDVDAALAAYDELGSEVQALLDDVKTLLDDLKDKIAVLKAVSSVVINKSETELWIADGMTAGSVAETLSATVTLGSGDVDTGHTVSWSSSASGIAAVDPNTGKLTAVAEGTATITVTTQGLSTDGEPASADCEVTISTAAAPTTATATLPVIDSLDGGWYAPDNGDRQTAPFPFTVGDEENAGAYYTGTWQGTITGSGFDSVNKAEGEASLKMSFDLTGDGYADVTLGINCSPVSVNDSGYYLLTFKAKATAEGQYDAFIKTDSENKRFPFTAGENWNSVVIHTRLLTADITGFYFQAVNQADYANHDSRIGSLWIDDIRLAAEIDLHGAHFEDNGYVAHDDNAGSGHSGWFVYAVESGWERYQAADDIKQGSWIFNSSRTGDNPYPGTETIHLTDGEWKDFLMAGGLDKPNTNILDIDLVGLDWGTRTDIAYVKFQGISAQPGKNHQVNIFTNGPDDKMILVKLNDNPAVIVSLPSVETGANGDHTWQCIFGKQLVVGPFKGDGTDILWVSGTIGGGWANIHHIDVKDAPEN